jgi:superfamily II DNA or RNA helicase
MRATISNKIFIKNFSLELIDYCQKHLVLDNPDYYIAEKMGRYTKHLEKYLYLYEANNSDLILPFGVLDEIWQKYLGGKCEEILTDFAPEMPLTMQGEMELYDYQQLAIKELVSAKNGVLQAPCGSGKTQIGIGLIKALGQKALWVTHTTDLLNQSLARAKQYFDGDFGVITDGKVSIGKDITFATVQTLSKIDLWQYNKEWNVVIIDECHRAAGTPTKVKQFYKIMSYLKARHKYGLSATLDRADGLIKSVFALLGNIKHIISDKVVGTKIIKAEHKVIATTLVDNLDAYCGTDGTMIYANLIQYIANDQERNDLITKNIAYKTLGHHLVLSHRVEHLHTLNRLLSALNIKTALVTGITPKDYREQLIQKVRDGEIKVLLATYSLAKEGLDIPILDTLHLATPNKNKAIVVQSMGRIERNIDGKTIPQIYDYVDFNIGYCVGMAKARKRIIEKRN